MASGQPCFENWRLRSGNEDERNRTARPQPRHHRQDGRIKLYLHWRRLAARRQAPGLFSSGAYQPAGREGRRENCLFAFLRTDESRTAVVAVPRLTTSLVKPGQFPLGDEVWKDTELSLPGIDPGTVWSTPSRGDASKLSRGTMRVPCSRPARFSRISRRTSPELSGRASRLGTPAACRGSRDGHRSPRPGSSPSPARRVGPGPVPEQGPSRSARQAVQADRDRAAESPNP